jgi:hypothetical protein
VGRGHLPVPRICSADHVDPCAGSEVGARRHVWQSCSGGTAKHGSGDYGTGPSADSRTWRADYDSAYSASQSASGYNAAGRTDQEVDCLT